MWTLTMPQRVPSALVVDMAQLRPDAEKATDVDDNNLICSQLVDVRNRSDRLVTRPIDSRSFLAFMVNSSLVI
jgi:hypothetical protein